MKKIFAIAIVIFMIFSLGACAKDVVDTPPTESVDDNKDIPSSEPEEVQDDINLELPEKKMLPMSLEGMEEEREAKLHESKYGYYIYILEGYTFNETDAGNSVISMDYDPEFYTQVTNLANDLDKESWKKDVEERLKEFGEIHEINSEEHFHEYFRDAEYYLLASSTKGSVIYMLHEVDDSLVEYKLNMPSKEAAEGAGPSLWTMLKTIEIK